MFVVEIRCIYWTEPPCTEVRTLLIQYATTTVLANCMIIYRQFLVHDSICLVRYMLSSVRLSIYHTGMYCPPSPEICHRIFSQMDSDIKFVQTVVISSLGKVVFVILKCSSAYNIEINYHFLFSFWSFTVCPYTWRVVCTSMSPATAVIKIFLDSILVTGVNI